MATLFCDVGTGHDLDPADQGRRDVKGQFPVDDQDAVLPVADPQTIFHRLEVYIGGIAPDGLDEHFVYRLDHEVFRVLYGRPARLGGL